MVVKSLVKKIILISSFFLVPVVAAQQIPPPSTPSATISLKFPRGASVQQKRAIIQQRLQSIKNQTKTNLALSIFDKLNAINVQRTTQLKESITRMNNVLTNLQLKITQAKAGGVNTTAVAKAAADAKKSLTAAQTAVDKQAVKVYVIDASDEAALKPNAGQQISQLQADLQILKGLVIDAKQKIALVIRELAKTGVGKVGQKAKDASVPAALFQPFIPK